MNFVGLLVKLFNFYDIKVTIMNAIVSCVGLTIITDYINVEHKASLWTKFSSVLNVGLLC